MLELFNVYKDYYVDKKPVRALTNINLYFPKQQFCSILGPSGCGKTTTLNIIGGLDQYTEGDLVISGISTKEFKDKDWDNYRNKRIGFVFQTYNLISHLNILENVAMALTLSGVDRKTKYEKAREALDKVGLKDLYHKKPNQLSGGQMQRVAIARALVNNPEIVLADEPTGALDSKTSIQIMDILKEVSKDRLVIMVTHNQELAVQYSDRIIRFKDGEIESDTWTKEKIEKSKTEEKVEFCGENEQELTKKELKKKEKMSSMSFWTALKLSFKNILTKRGRTIMTSIAGSFGIIGVALVLAVNNGFSDYIARTEQETASQLPISIQTYSVKTTLKDSKELNPLYPDTQEVYVYQNEYLNTTIQYNNLNQKYIDYIGNIKKTTNLINDYILSYNNSYSMNLVTTNPETNKPYYVANGNSSGMASTISSVTGLSRKYWHVLYGEEQYISQSYDVIAGTYPRADHMEEICLILDERNQLNLNALKNLGFYPNESKITTKYAENHPIKFEDILGSTNKEGKKYKVFKNADILTESSYEVPNSNKKAYKYDIARVNDIFEDKEKGIELKITGILRPKPTVSFASMAPGLCYQKSLQEYLVNENKKLPMMENVKNNVTWKEGMSVDDFLKDIQELATGLNGVDTTDEESIAAAFASSNNMSSLNSLFNKYFSFYHFISGSSHNSSNTDYTASNFLSWCRNFGIEIVDDELKEAGIEGLSDYLLKIMSYIAFSKTNHNVLYFVYPYVISLIGYINSFTNIEGLIIFPTGLSQKQELIKKMDEYNEIDTTQTNQNRAWSANEQIYYTDLVGTLTDSLGQMINIISVVLIIFASISLVVSCVMTGIITYVSVIERTKEIGVLRSMGARKKDVGRLFEAECVIIGAFSGLFGCGIAYIICVPINIILNHLYGEYNIGNIANLAWGSVILLVAISIVLTFISSLLPSRSAAKKDPVTALRTE